MDQFLDVRAERTAAGWKRGAFISLNDHPMLKDELPKKLVTFLQGKKNPRIVPVLYDCALIEECFQKEPWAQVVLCWEIEKGNGNFVHAKNPRTLHTYAKLGDEELTLEITAMSFAQIDREALLSCMPDKTIEWKGGRLEQLLDWVAERFRQPTFPDSFNDRLKSVVKNLDKQWKKPVFQDYCAGVYFRLNTRDELAEGHNYELDIIITIPSSITGKKFAEFDANHSQDVIQGIKTKISSAQGIVVGSVEIYPESEFTKDIERNFLRFSLEYFSYKSPGLNTLLPAEFNSSGW